MSIVASWSGEGLVDGTPVDTSTAGTGDAPFTTVTPGAATVEASGLHGPRIRIEQAAATEAQLVWGTAVLGALSAHAVRIYVELSAHPPGNGRILAAHDASNVLQWWLDVTSAGILRLRDPGGSAKDTSAAALPVGVELRVEVVADGAGAVTVAVYEGDSTAPWDVLAGTGFGTTVQQLRILNPNTSPTWPAVMVDEVAVADTAAEIGPVPPPPGPAPAFPDAPLVVDVDLKVGDTWERITPDVYTADPITIERGRADEAGEVAPSKLSLTLRNTAGKYSPRNPRSTYFGLIGRNTPIRVRVDHAALPPAMTYAYLPGLESHYLATPDAAALDLTDVVDVRIEITPDSWRPDMATLLATKMNPNTGDDSWSFILRTTGELRFRWTADGTASTSASSNSTVPVPADAGRLAVRCVFDGTGAGTGGNRSYTFYTADSIDGPWTQLGDVTTGTGTGAIYSGSAALEIGTGMGGTRGFFDARVFHGRVHDFQLCDETGAVVADPGISAGPDLVGAEWDGPDGLPWTAYGSARIITGGPAYRFHGEVSEWPPRWSLGGHRKTVPIQAAGIKRRLGQGAAPIQSPLRRSIPVTDGIMAYWPMEDAGGAFASAYAGAPSLLVTSGGSTVAYGVDEEFPGSAPLPMLHAGRAVATVPAYVSPDGIHTVLMVMHMAAEPEGTRQLLEIVTTGSVRRWDVWYSVPSHSLGMTAYDREGNKVITDTVANVPADGVPQQLAVRLEQVGGDVWMTIVGLPLGSDTTVQWTATASGSTVGRITSVILGDPADLGETALGHLAVSTSVLADVRAFTRQVLGYPGETAGARLARLCDEAGVPLQIIGQLADTAPMGPQRVDTLLTLLEECAAADGGILGEARDEAGFLYRSRASLYNQDPALQLDYGAPGLAAPFEPTDDDQNVVNDVTVTREGGSSARAVLEAGPLSVLPPEQGGVGIYDDAVTVNVATDEQLPHVAGWLLHLGTWDEARFPNLGVKLHKTPDRIAAAAGMDFGDRATVAGMPPWLPPEDADTLVQGYAEVIELLRWRIDCNATPARPWRVWQLGVEGFDRLDTDGSELADAVGADDTVLTVASTAGPPWTTDPADWPLDLLIGGERVTVTAVAGESSPQTFTVVRAVNGISKPHPAGTEVTLADPVVIAL